MAFAEDLGLRPSGSNPCGLVKRYREQARDRYLTLKVESIPVFRELNRVAGKVKCRDVDRLIEHIEAFPPTQSRFLDVYKDLLIAAEKASALRKGQLQ